jgi:hypothetical protein
MTPGGPAADEAGSRPREGDFVSICMTTKKIDARHLVEDYRELQRRLGKYPTCLEYARECHSISTLCDVLGRPGWRKLVQAAGGKLYARSPRITRQHLIDCYARQKEDLGRIPTAKEYSGKCHSITTLNKLFNGRGWSNLLLAAGDQPSRRYLRRGPSKTSLLSAFLRIQAELGKEPAREEYLRLSGYALKDLQLRFSGDPWETLVNAAKVWKGPSSRRRLSAEHLIRDFLDLQRALGRRPAIGEYMRRCHTPKVLDRVFGKSGWKNLIAAVGEQALPKGGVTASQLVDLFLKIRRRLGREPVFLEFKSRYRRSGKVLDRIFGSPGWGNLKLAAERKMQEREGDSAEKEHCASRPAAAETRRAWL